MLLEHLATQHAGHSKLHSIQHAAISNRITAAKVSLKAFVTDASKWEVEFRFPDQRARLEGLLREFDLAAWECKDAEVSFKQLKAENKASEVAKRKAFNDQQYKIEVWLNKVAMHCPALWAHACAELAYHHFQDWEAATVTPTFTSRPIQIDADKNRKTTYGSPWLARALTVADWKNSDSREGNVVEKALWKFLGAEADACVAKVAVQRARLTPTDAIRVSCLDLVGAPFAWSGGADGIVGIHPAANFPHLLITQRCLVANWNITTQPFRNHSGLLTCWESRMFIAILPPDLVAEAGADIQRWFGTFDDFDAESNIFGTWLEFGDTVFVPFEHVPIYMGAGMETELSSKVPKLSARGRQSHGRGSGPTPSTETTTVGFTLLLESTMAEEKTEGNKLMLANWALAKPSLPRAMRDSDVITKWYEALATASQASTAASVSAD